MTISENPSYLFHPDNHIFKFPHDFREPIVFTICIICPYFQSKNIRFQEFARFFRNSEVSLNIHRYFRKRSHAPIIWSASPRDPWKLFAIVYIHPHLMFFFGSGDYEAIYSEEVGISLPLFIPSNSQVFKQPGFLKGLNKE